MNYLFQLFTSKHLFSTIYKTIPKKIRLYFPAKNIILAYIFLIPACQFTSNSEKIKNKFGKDTVSMAEQLQLLQEELQTVDSLWVMEMKKHTEKDTTLIKRLEEIKGLRTKLEEAIKSKDEDKKMAIALTIQNKVLQNKAQTENKVLKDTLNFLREKNQTLEKELQAKNPEEYQNNIIAEQHYQRMIKQNQMLQQEIAKLKGIAYLTKFDIRACQVNGKTAKSTRRVDYFEMNFEFQQSEKPTNIADHRISYKAFKDGKDIVFRKLDNAKKITLTSERFRKGRYDLVMLLDGKEIGKTAINLN